MFSSDNTYFCTLGALDQVIIYNNISPINRRVWSEELDKLNVHLIDISTGSPTEALIGVDVILEDGLLGIEMISLVGVKACVT